MYVSFTTRKRVFAHFNFLGDDNFVVDEIIAKGMKKAYVIVWIIVKGGKMLRRVLEFD